MRKWISLLLCMVLVLSLMPSALAEEKAPAVGDMVHGFVLQEIGTLDIAAADTYLYKHEKSGANLLYIKNSDINRAFDITFRTPAIDNAGSPHVFEHAVLNGSDRYPASNILFTLLYQTYNTFVNGMTGDTYTTYPISSLSEDQLMAMMDVYMAGVLEPLLLKEPRLVSREAWRYEMESADAPITIKGTVYSEMLGSNTIFSMAEMGTRKALYPDSIIGNNPGGDPKDIPSLTQQTLIDYHEAYYHPSNAMIVLYGDLDNDRFMKALDENYLSAYDARDVQVETGIVDVQDGFEQVSIDFPMERDASAENAACIQYGYAMQDISELDAVGMSVLLSALTHESSTLTTAVRAAMPGAQLSARLEDMVSMPYVSFLLNGANPSDAESFKQIVDEQLQQLMQTGYDREIIDGVIAQQRFSMMLTSENATMGVNVAIALSAYWTLNGTTTYFNDMTDSLNQVEGMIEQKYFENLTQQLIDAKRKSLVTMVPKPGLIEQNAEVLAGELAAYKATLSDEQIAQMVSDNAELTAWSAQETPKEIKEKIQVVPVESLPEEIPSYEIIDRSQDGTRFMTVKAEVDEVGYTMLMLPSDFLPADKVPYFALYTQLIGSMPTEKYSRDEVTRLTSRHLNSFAISPSAQMMSDQEDPAYSMMVQWISLMDHYEEDLEFVDELLFHSDFRDVDELKGFVKRQIATTEQSINHSPLNTQMIRAVARSDAQIRYYLMSNGLDYLNFLKQVESELESNPSAVIETLNAIMSDLYNREGAISIFAGNQDGIDKSNGMLEAYFEDMPIVDYQMRYTYDDIPLPAAHEAIVVDSAVQYNMVVSSLKALGVEADGRLETLGNLLGDLYITPILRHQMGVYSPFANITDKHMMAYTYRDPNLAKTYEVFEGMAEYLRGLTLEQAEVDPYILSTYSGYVQPRGQLNGAIAAALRVLEGKTDEKLLQYMREIKQLKAEDLPGYADLFDTWYKEGAHSTSGSQAAIEADAALFDEILMPFAAETPAETVDEAE